MNEVGGISTAVQVWNERAVVQQVSRVQRVDQIWLTAFALLQSAFLVVYGAQEVLFDGDRSRVNRNLVNFSKVHGTLFFASGFLTAAAYLDQYWYTDVRRDVNNLFFYGDATFILASIAAIKHNVDLYVKAKALPDDPTLDDIKHADQVKRSSVMGILSSLGYILSGLGTLVGAATAYVIVFGGVAVSTGGIKILYDFFILERRTLDDLKKVF